MDLAGVAMRRLTWLLFALLLACTGLYWTYRPASPHEALLMMTPVPGAKDIQGLNIVRVFGDLQLDHPLYLTWAPGDADHVYVATQPGMIHRLKLGAGGGGGEVFRDLRSQVRGGGEEGLLGLAFDPEYATNGFFYVYYSPISSPRRTVVERLSRGDKRSSTLLEIAQPYPNHKGGWIAFGPDGMLYVGTGDGGSGNDPENRAQNLSELLGKILRIDPRGDAPPDNPFVGRKDAKPQIWAYGLRNPWRGAFDRQTGDLWVGDVGQNEIEEIDLVTRGGNYGWRMLEGGRPNLPGDAGGALPPVHSYDHRYGCSVIGGYVYRGERVPAAFGKYFFTDFCSGRVWSLERGADSARVVHFATVPQPTSFGEDADGELYITSFDGHVYQLVP